MTIIYGSLSVCLYAAGAVLLTAVFSLSVNFFSFSSIKKIDMASSLKSVE